MKKAVVVLVALLLVGSAIFLMLLPNNDYDAFHDIQYGDDDRNRMDIYLPSKLDNMDDDVPVFMYIHGGGWTGGDKSDGKGWREAMQYIGCALVSINYRFITVGDADPNTAVGCDDMMDDIMSAVTYLRDNFGRYRIDTNGMAIGGDSAGGHLSLLYAYSMESPIPVKFVMSRVGPTDFTDPDFYKEQIVHPDPEYDRQKMTPEIATILVNALAGTSYTVDQLSTQTGDGLEGMRSISPIHHIEPGTPIPFTLLLYGKMDNVVPLSQASNMVVKLTTGGFIKGTDFEYVEFPNSWHNLADDDDHAKTALNIMLKELHELLGTKYVQI